MQRLDIATFPLAGTRLIEASAGTGKTFTLTALYLRLLLEKGLDVSQLLVVTFTEAATDELRGRVRARLRDAALAFEAGHTEDPVLAGLLARLTDHGEHAQQLRDAVTRMDEAAIFTIHGFCQRMLSEHAFESGALFDTELTTDERSLQEAVVNDFWRVRFYAGDSALAAWVGQRWASPAALLDALSPWTRNAAPRVLPVVDEARLAAAQERVVQSFAKARALWRKNSKTLVRSLHDAVAQDVLSRDKKKGYPPDYVDELAASAEVYYENTEPPGFAPPALVALTAAALTAAHKKPAAKKGLVPPQHPFFEAMEDLLTCVAELDVLREASLLLEAAAYLRDGLARRKRENRQWTFNDLLVDMAAALSGPGGPALAKRILERFPAALVDEFQDTDPLQYRIFDTVYGDAGDAAWYMIGDPKQAIYGFRGADIFTYIQARRDTDADSQHFTLDTNWRSAERLVRAVNTLFDQARAPFIFDRDIHFHPVRAAGRADEAPLTLDGSAPSALQVWFVERTSANVSRGTITKDWAHTELAASYATEIARLLQLGAEGRARIGDRSLTAGDLAILVRDRFDAEAMRSAFARVGIKSVYLSRDSVFETPEAEALEHVLAAVAEPGVARRLRAALATELVGVDAHTLAAGEDDPRWLDWLTLFQGYHELWAEDGFMPFFQRFLRDQSVTGRLLAQTEGERRLTNLLQLGELAQAQSETVWGMEGLLRWLGEHRRHPNGDAEDQQLRLESDAGLVKIVTIHKSKGLEYPIVFLPFIWGSRPRKASKSGRLVSVDFHDRDDRAYTLDLGSDQHTAHHALSDRERLAEDLRLLYVALTRASHRCYLSWGQFYGAADSALAYLLHPAVDGERFGSDVAARGDAELRAAWETLADAADGAIDVIDVPEKTLARAPQTGVAPERLSARPMTVRVPRGWQMASYSALISGREVEAGSPFAPSVAAEVPDYDAVDAPPAEPVRMVETEKPFSNLFQFPRGARAGTFMHSLLERLDFPSGAGIDHTPPALLTERLLQRHGFDVRWRDVIMNMVGNVLDTGLGAGGRLRDVPRQRRLVEMEFYFPLGEVKHAALNDFLASYRGGSGGARLAFGAVTGLMKGFVDLIFEHDGRFFIADYKSNHLGDSAADYTPQALEPAIIEHDYDLQYLIYAVALHRYLSHRITDYDYERHFGGVYYLFLRGMDAGSNDPTGVYFHRPRREQVEALDALLTGDES